MSKGLRFSVAEAVQRGWIKPDEIPSDTKGGQAASAPRPPRKQYTSELPQDRLFNLLRSRWGDRVMSEYRGAVPGRRFRIDVAIPDAMIACECDGYRYHKTLSAFINDRTRGRLLVIHGWRVLHFPVHTIFKEPDIVIRDVGALLGELPDVADIDADSADGEDAGERDRAELLRYLND